MSTQEYVMYPCPHCGTMVIPFVGSSITVYGESWGCWEPMHGGNTTQLAKHCPNCGGEITITCPICRLPHLAGFKFCMVQGKSLEDYQREREEAQRAGIEQQKRDTAATQMRREYEELRDHIVNQLRSEAFLTILSLKLVQLAVVALTLWFSYGYFQPSGFGFVVWLLIASAAGMLPGEITIEWWEERYIFEKADAETKADFAARDLKPPS